MTQETQEVESTDQPAARVLGIVADPDMPTQIGSRLAERLKDWLAERTGEGWTVEVVSDPVTAGESDSEQILRSVERELSRNNWSYAISLTDLPLLLTRSPLMADASTERGVAVVSFPALGGLQPYRRMRQMLTQLLDDLLTESKPAKNTDPADHRMASWLTDKLAPIRRSTPPGDRIDVRYTTSRGLGWARLVSGMVRANRPWQLVWGLSGALAAALAAAGFGLFTSTVWQLGDVMGPLRAVGVTAFSVAIMTTWLVGAHGLWERVGRRAVRDRRLALLYNASTVATLVLGVACMYGVVYLVGLVAAACILDSSVVSSMVGHPANPSTYLKLAWMVASMALVAGALGSSMESDAAVRQAAYGYREEQRRANQADSE